MLKRLNFTDLNEMFIIEKICFGEGAWSIIMLASEIMNPFSFVYGSFEESKLRGYCSFRAVEDEGHINNIAVLPEYRRQGCASELINYMLEKGRKREIRRFTLEVRTENTGAIALYKKMGFKTAGIRPNYYGEGKNALIMWRVEE